MAESFKLDLTQRPRRLRRTASLRQLVTETVLRPADFIAPLFVIDGKSAPQPIASMPGVSRFAINDLVKECRALAKLGVPAVALFPKLDARLKDEEGTAALHEDALILRAVRAVKKAVPELTIMTDIALDPYTTHGHDGVLTPARDDVDNDRTVEILVKMAVLHARAGVDLVAPSDMMDGRVGAIRQALDAAGCTGTGIMAYSVKFASAYYGPFRDAVGSATAAGTHLLSKATYQLDPANRRTAMTELALDEAEGADIVMVKPAGPYLDIIRDVRNATNKPVAAYQVSGEYAQLQAAAKLGWLDLARTRHESLLAIKRAGADMILTYFAKEMATELKR
ncbi:porphobilinogen synthase [Opitutus terrae]|uniref:Delta-aminolevulinic acid dehydratase n=1 Tax=Opitutus terrae (strain DSM 11246 / JCM 15787 / PB90-1) TaxID=452637 RepID=B1ZSY0_OPITP|nr:porphobilinogen synthase [Opitutus terrae]ACB75769.1 Porphobilinogen synthase [Opitutus terrae PB90-1]